MQNSFSSDQESTIQATYLDKRLNVGKKSVKLMIWDTAGQERFHALGPIYYRDAVRSKSNHLLWRTRLQRVLIRCFLILAI